MESNVGAGLDNLSGRPFSLQWTKNTVELGTAQKRLDVRFKSGHSGPSPSQQDGCAIAV